MERNKRKKPTNDVDLTIPLDKSKVKGSGCFGKMFDITSPECPKCADREVCHIIFKDLVDSKAKKLKADGNKYYLDETDFTIDTNSMVARCKSGKTTTKELIQWVHTLAKTDDRKAVIEWIKRWIKSDSRIKTQKGIVWLT